VQNGRANVNPPVLKIADEFNSIYESPEILRGEKKFSCILIFIGYNSG
jgi:hypothetical protein